MDALMERYDALNNTETIPTDYCRQLNALAVDFDRADRVSMAETCRRRADAYKYKRYAFLSW